MDRQETKQAIKEGVTGVTIGVCIVLLFLFTGHHVNTRAENAELREKLESYETQQGGAESEHEQMDVDYEGFIFPIHPDDFLFYTSPFGVRVSPILNREMHHNGLDIAAIWKAQVVAISDGTIVEHWPPPDGHFRGHRVYGGMIKIEHDDGFESLYAHLSWSNVRTGDRVKAGEVIGRIGNTGMSRGYHLHVEILHNGEYVNPLLYIQDPHSLEES